MNRIFLTLIVTAFLFLFGTFALGLSLGDVHNPDDRLTQQMKQLHFMAGVFSCMFVILVHCIVITWFVGTSRWCKEVVDAYHLSKEFSLRSAQLKRKTFPLAVICMLAIVGVAALGACADPGAAVQVKPPGGFQWSNIHLMGALLVIAFVGYTFLVEWQNIDSNSQVISEIMDHVRKIRLDRGLDVDTENNGHDGDSNRSDSNVDSETGTEQQKVST